MNKKIIWGVVIVVAVVAALLTGINKNSVTGSELKTLSNPMYGYEVEYPSNLIVHDAGPMPRSLMVNMTKFLRASDNPDALYIYIATYKRGDFHMGTRDFENFKFGDKEYTVSRGENECEIIPEPTKNFEYYISASVTCSDSAIQTIVSSLTFTDQNVVISQPPSNPSPNIVKTPTPQKNTSVKPSISISPAYGKIGTTITIAVNGSVPSGTIIYLKNDSGNSGFVEVKGTKVSFIVPTSIQGHTECTKPRCIADPMPIVTAPGIYQFVMTVPGESAPLSTAQFTVITSPTVVFPNGGESLALGSKTANNRIDVGYYLTPSGQFPDTLTYLVDSTGKEFLRKEVGRLTDGPGRPLANNIIQISFNQTNEAPLKPGQYKIKICDLSNNCDMSDNYFTITN